MAGPVFEYVERIGSTNAELLARIARGETPSENRWLIADRQTDGRGRRGRSWQDGNGNFMGSTALPVRAGEPPMHTLSLVAGVALYETVAALLPVGRRGSLALKWPNDLLIGWAKLAGILLELRDGHVVIGFGVNLASAPQLAERETAALRDLGVVATRDEFAAQLAGAMQSEIALWRGEGLGATVARWTGRGPPLGAPAVAGEGEGALTGEYRGLDADGALLLRLADGSMRAIHSGEVALTGDPALRTGHIGD